MYRILKCCTHILSANGHYSGTCPKFRKFMHKNQVKYGFDSSMYWRTGHERDRQLVKLCLSVDPVLFKILRDSPVSGNQNHLKREGTK